MGSNRWNLEGYRFKSFDAARAMASANPNEVSSPHLLHLSEGPQLILIQDLKSPEELEEEDRAAKSAVSLY